MTTGSMNTISVNEKTAPRMGIIGYSDTSKSGSYPAGSAIRKTINARFNNPYTMRCKTLPVVASDSRFPNIKNRKMKPPVIAVVR